MVIEAIHSVALECGCGRCVACKASAGDKQAIAEVFIAINDAEAKREAAPK